MTSTRPGTTIINTTQGTRPQTSETASTSSAVALGNDGNNGDGSGSGGGLTTGATTAIAVVIPVVVVALLVGLGIWFWRKRKSKKNAAEQRQKEMEDYSYNPNGDPTLPAIGSDAGGTTQMQEDHSSGYRGWGAAAAGTMSNRKQSTTLSAGNTHDMAGSGAGSDYGPSYGGYRNSPHGNTSDGHSGDPLVYGHQRSTMGSDDIAELGTGPSVGAAAAGGGIRRGPSNASSAYSAGARSDDDHPPMPPPGQAYDYNPNGGGFGYGQAGPYGDGSYGGGGQADMPVVRDVSARRNTRIQPGGSYQQGNSGIAQNF
ncbi:MAG: hypothetical protein INR62_14020 [Rhodospirillales bacterium]|nr:hypothetical protein [Acetobacter sp.]